jgi:NAD(P)H-hydrate epimerase
VLDADALTVFQGSEAILFNALHENCVLTPHEGEFAALFGAPGANRQASVERAAKACGCSLLLKGAHTVVAGSDDGHQMVVNDHATSWLATAGAGDVLAGMIAGLLAQGVAPFKAACAGVWLHGEAGLRCGPGLVAPDLIAILPAIMRDFA